MPISFLWETVPVARNAQDTADLIVAIIKIYNQMFEKEKVPFEHHIKTQCPELYKRVFGLNKKERII